MPLRPIQAGQGEGKAAVHVNYAGGWLLAPFIADMAKKTEWAFGELAAVLKPF